MEFKDCQKTMEYYAKKYGAINKVPYEDMYQQSVVIFYNCVAGYSADKKVTFKTYLAGALDKDLRRYAMKYRQKTSIDIDPEVLIPTYRHVECRNPEKTVLFWDTIHSLSDEATNMLSLLFKEVQEIGLDSDDPGKKMRGKVRKFAHKELGLSQRKIDTIFKEIKTFTSLVLAT